MISQIPRGRVASYGDVAKMAGLPGYARYVGYLLKSVPIDTSLPWHRVVRSDGTIPQETIVKQKAKAHGREGGFERPKSVSGFILESGD